MNKVKPFKWVFWMEVPDLLQRKTQRKSEGALDVATSKVDVLDCRPLSDFYK